VRRDRVRLPDGNECLREYVRHQGAVVVIAELEDERLLFVRQYRYPLRRPFLELPAGKIDPRRGNPSGHRPARVARGNGIPRKLEWRHLGVMHPCVGYSDERIEIYLARGLTRAKPNRTPDSNEFLDVLSLPLADALAAVQKRSNYRRKDHHRAFLGREGAAHRLVTDWSVPRSGVSRDGRTSVAVDWCR
jgi:ADP-ribose pyrophosphatase